MKRVFVIDGTTIILSLIVFAIGYALGRKEREDEKKEKKDKSEGS